MQRQATQPAAVPTGRKRRRVCAKTKEASAKPTTGEGVTSVFVPPPTEEVSLPPPEADRPATSLSDRGEQVHQQIHGVDAPPQTVEGLMNATLKDYEEEVVDKSECPLKPGPSREVGEWEEYDVDNMDATLNFLLYPTSPFHPHQYIHCMNPQGEFGRLRYKCPQEGCSMYFFEDTRQIILDKLKYETHPQDEIESHR